MTKRKPPSIRPSTRLLNTDQLDKKPSQSIESMTPEGGDQDLEIKSSKSTHPVTVGKYS